MDSITEQRVKAFQALIELAATLGLPVPMDVTFTISRAFVGEQLISLRLDDNNRDAVARWTEALELGPVSERRVGDFIAVKAEAWDDGATWLGFRQVEVWSACDKRGRQ